MKLTNVFSRQTPACITRSQNQLPDFPNSSNTTAFIQHLGVLCWQGQGWVVASPSRSLIASQNPLHHFCSGMRPDHSTFSGWEKGCSEDLYTVLMMFSTLFFLPILPSPDPSFSFQTLLPSHFSPGLRSLTVGIRGRSRNGVA